nr:transforming acidic coiled-coil-containing protein 2-like [Paramormyrops kingsleyae]
MRSSESICPLIPLFHPLGKPPHPTTPLSPPPLGLMLQEELVLAALRIEALQVAQKISQTTLPTVTTEHQREASSPVESAVTKSTLYSRTGYSEEDENPYMPRDLDHSLGIAREEIVAKEKEAAEWQRKYEESRQEVVEMRRVSAFNRGGFVNHPNCLITTDTTFVQTSVSRHGEGVCIQTPLRREAKAKKLSQ